MASPVLVASTLTLPADPLHAAVVACAVALGLALLLAVRSARQRNGRLRSRLRESRSTISHLQDHDALTGLASRAVFEDACAAAPDDAPLAVLAVGLDHFRPLNEGYGHAVGDALLVQVGRRLVARAGRQATVARLGGDEFALLVRLPQDNAAAAGAAVQPTALTHAGALADALLATLQQPFQIDGLLLQVNVSIGVAVQPDLGTHRRLLSLATVAMRAVKLAGGAGRAFHDAAMATDVRERAELLQDLRRALAENQLQLVYQPKIDARSLQITAAEALLRWKHPTRGMVSPALFIPLAERHGLIGAIGAWVIDEACRQAAVWRSSGLRMRVAINLSGQQLRQDDLVDRILAALKRHGIPAGRLTCEITETLAVEDTAHTRATFEQLRRAGLHVSIDDFGTGHSSLAVLRRLAAAELKIDRAFVADLGAGGEAARSIVQAIVQMAHSLGLRVVAEGVETAAERDILVALGCDELQGYLFARPMSATAIALWSQDDRGAHTRANSFFRPSLFEPTKAAPLDS